MEVSVYKFTSEDKGQLKKAFGIREEVFIVEQQVPEDLEKDSHDKTAIHYLLTLDGKAVATARRRLTSEGIKLERFATLKGYRNRGLGAKILLFVLDDIRDQGENIYLNAQAPAVSFYARHGFKKQGEPFMEAGISHYRMYYNE
ncbi:MAG: GNAT family N-acetyltransferase [Bacteroidota bacterium]